ncbi:hypothetical protein ACIKTA_07435 [Hansschlegelia beijingensis]|uniref:hypothetical protein n=1 Tax=Hansschlegelia beijingensis TaxID=1133344 RepID=UPI003807FB15
MMVKIVAVFILGLILTLSALHWVSLTYGVDDEITVLLVVSFVYLTVGTVVICSMASDD